MSDTGRNQRHTDAPERRPNRRSSSRYEQSEAKARKRHGGSPVLRAIIIVLFIILIVLILYAIFGLRRGTSSGDTRGGAAQVGSEVVGTLEKGLSSLLKQDDTASGTSGQAASANAVSGQGGDGNTDNPAAAAGSDGAGQTSAQNGDGSAEAGAGTAETSSEPASSSAAAGGAHEDTISQAALLAAGYDYDGAIQLLETIEDYQDDATVLAAISSYEETKASCVAVDVYSVPHIFYHSLINDTDRAFDVSTLGQAAVDGFNAWMTTVDEFDKITQQLYDNGYVYVRLRDLVVETKNADGTSHFEANTNLMLPPGKKAIVLSVDDLSYYHSYAAAGYPDKLVLDENGDVKCQYTDAGGSTTIGDYDVVPRLNTFLAQHPDGAYHGARGLIAMTGYDGCFGYRTDQDYEEQKNLMSDQAAWLAAHPDFNRQEEIEQATIIANALKDEGWEFASHTWGHLSVTQYDVDKLRTDNERWVANVENIVGPVDTIIFAHGNDIGDWTNYTTDNPKYAYYHSAGYNFFCNVDGSVPSWVQITSDYVRQGRIDLDGYMLYQASTGQTHVLDNLFDASSVFDSRRPTPVIANGQS